MKTAKINFHALQNGEHVDFCVEFVSDINNIGTKNLEATTLLEEYIAKVDTEKEINKTLLKSALTEQIVTTDHELDNVYRGVFNLVETNVNHFNPQKALAANAIKLVFDRLGNVPEMGYHNEITNVNKLVTTLKSDYATQVEDLGLEEWIIQLDTKCKHLVSLIAQRTSDETAKPELSMRAARLETDKLYNQIIAIFDAHLLIGNNTNISKLIANHNTRIENYKQTVLQRQGRNDKEKENTTKTN